MRIPFATVCLALALAGCRGSGNGLLSRMTIPPPGTQPPGALLADNSYYPAGTSPATSTWGSGALATAGPATPTGLLSPNFNQPGSPQLTERRGAALTRANLSGPARAAGPATQEEAIRIPDDSAFAGTLAAVVPIRGIPTTDATPLFDQIRSQLAPRASLAVQQPASSGFVEISQLRDAPAAIRRAALSQRQLR